MVGIHAGVYVMLLGALDSCVSDAKIERRAHSGIAQRCSTTPNMTGLNATHEFETKVHGNGLRKKKKSLSVGIIVHLHF